MNISFLMIWLLIFCVPCTFGNEMQSVIGKIHRKIQEGNDYCRIQKTHTYLDRCNEEVKNGTVPYGSICSFLTTRGEVETYTCDQGFWVHIASKGTGIDYGHSLQKRSWGLVALGLGVGLVACIILCSNQGSTIVNKPPKFKSCPDDKAFTADKMATSVRVNWTKPEATDPEGSLKSVDRTKGDAPGSMFEAGTHTIVYKAEDNHGNTDICIFTVKITVIYCYYGFSLYLANGRASCNTPAVYGTKCSFVCNDGYQLTNYVSLTCEKDGIYGKWTPADGPTCEKKKCEEPTSLCNGFYFCTDGSLFGSICYPFCDIGFRTDIRKFIRCNGETWEGINDILPCEDIEPPSLSYCPSFITEYADESGTTIVSWREPRGNDNSDSNMCGNGAGLEVKRISGESPGSVFKIGFHQVEYELSDNAGNSVFCSFVIFVTKLYCNQLIPKDPYLNLKRCSNSNVLGSTCELSCSEQNHVMIGSNNVTCEKDPNEDDKAYWAWKDSTETICEYQTCPALPVPNKGALACTVAVGNRICTMSCSNGTQVPKDTSVQYVCTEDLTWAQGIPPNCTNDIHPKFAMLPGNLFYFYPGDCSDPTTQNLIKENFKDAMESLESTDSYQNICPDFCTVEGVTVTCGQGNGRRRRDLGSLTGVSKVRRTTSEIAVDFNLTSTWQNNKNLWGNDDDLQLLANFLKGKVADGSFDYPGMTTGGMDFGWIEIDCPIGLEPVYATDASCVGCAPGKYLKNGSCLECEKGTYQANEYKMNCTQCPIGKSTGGKGSTSITQCEDQCPPGSFSTTGVVPCSPCPMGKYQPASDSTSCIPCNQFLYTSSISSVNETDCQDMDCAFDENSHASLDSLSAAVESFTLGFWMRCSNNSNTVMEISLANFEFTIGRKLSLSLPSKTYSISNEIDLTKWSHLAVSWKGSTKEVKFYVKGSERSSSLFDIASLDEIGIPPRSNLTLKGQDTGCTLSSFFMVDQILSATSINSQSTSCFVKVEGALFTMDSLYRARRPGVQLSKSGCDAVDECLSNPCGNGNLCTNEVEGYSCNCTSGYSGYNCQTPPDFCINNECYGNSTCISNFSNYSCSCPGDFTGSFCEHQIVHGNWGSWNDLTVCSASCNVGTKTRSRACNNPEPDLFGNKCEGSNTTAVTCNTHACPECPPWYTIRQYKNEFNCTTSGDAMSCTVTCKPGYSFVSTYYPLHEYSCGPETSYTWTGAPPSCGTSGHPLAISSSVSAQYQIDCSHLDSFSTTLSSNINSLQCVVNGTCDVNSQVSGCSSSSRKKRSLTTIEATISLDSDLSAIGVLQLDDFFASNIVSPGLAEFIRIYSDMDYSLYQLNSSNILMVSSSGEEYYADSSTLTRTINVTCPVGQVEEDYICVECPNGTYWSAGQCVLCSQRYYQSEGGQIQCHECPTGYTTNFVASISVNDCNVEYNVTEEPSSSREDQTTTSGPNSGADSTTGSDGNQEDSSTNPIEYIVTEEPSSSREDQITTSVPTSESIDYTVSDIKSKETTTAETTGPNSGADSTTGSDGNQEDSSTNPSNKLSSGNATLIVVILGSTTIVLAAVVLVILVRKYMLKNRNSRDVRISSARSVRGVNIVSPNMVHTQIGDQDFAIDINAQKFGVFPLSAVSACNGQKVYKK